MNILLFGSSGMVGQGVLRECLAAHGIERVHGVVRAPTGITHARWSETVLPDPAAIVSLLPTLPRWDACFFCLGVSSGGMSEADYTRITYDLTLTVATALAQRNPGMTFIYVSGAGTDSSERGRSMWARVKGRTENAILRLPFRQSVMFRPGVIQPLDGVKSKTAAYRRLYILTGWFLPFLRWLFPNTILTTRQIGRAMLEVAQHGTGNHIASPADIRRLSEQAAMAQA